MKKILVKTAVAALMATSLTGCIGQMAVTGLVMEGNLSVVDNRFARAGLYVLLSPVYGLSATADLFIFNTIEFWTGTNPISGQKALADTPVNALININSSLNEALTEGNADISTANISQLDEKTLEMSVAYADGRVQVLRGEKVGEQVEFYLNDEYVTVVSLDELERYATTRL